MCKRSLPMVATLQRVQTRSIGSIAIRLETSMNPSLPAIAPSFEVRYASLVVPGRVLFFPCDCQGRVDLDGLSERARLDYLFARAMVGRDYSLPCVGLSAHA
jgi:hypothetical protein